jgi:CubicO group peptidase (beta-lactamase class C family)
MQLRRMDIWAYSCRFSFHICIWFNNPIGTDAVVIVDDGVVIDAWGDISRNFQCHSMRKSLLSGLIGIHVDEGNIDLDATLDQLGIDDHAPSLSSIEKQATVSDLIRARSGIYHPALDI